MKKRTVFALFASLLTFPLLFGCQDKAPETPQQATGPKLSEYAIVCANASNVKLRTGVNAFQAELAKQGIDLSAYGEDDLADEGKQILVGETNRAASAVAKEKLAESTATNAYVIAFEEDTIAILGSNYDATMVGMKYFLLHYVNGDTVSQSAGEYYVGGYEDEVRIFSNLTQWTLEETSIIDKPPEDNPGATLKYPSIIELQHQPDPVNNGLLYATGERWVDDHMCPIYASADNGTTWSLLNKVEDSSHKRVRTAFAPCLFELPVQVGEMPAGTLILGANSIDNAWRNIYVVLYRSYDLGVTWEPFATVGASEGTGGFWEANFVCTDDGTLICYFSDDTDSFHSQKLVLRYTKDGENWSDLIETVALNDGGLRPGMPVVTRMGNGKYMMVYEIVGMAGNPIYYKVTDDPTDWGDPSDPGKRIMAGQDALAATPWVTWMPVGGENGMLVLTGWRMSSGKSETGSDIFVSFDYGESWTAIDNYYSYRWSNDNDTWGYSVSTFLSMDGKTMYYMANPKGDGERTTWYKLFKIRVE